MALRFAWQLRNIAFHEATLIPELQHMDTQLPLYVLHDVDNWAPRPLADRPAGRMLGAVAAKRVVRGLFNDHRIVEQPHETIVRRSYAVRASRVWTSTVRAM